MSLQVKKGDFVWVFPRDAPGKVYPVGAQISLDVSANCSHFSVVVLEKVGDMLENKGHTYIAIAREDTFQPSNHPVWEKPRAHIEKPARDERSFDLHILDAPEDQPWDQAVSSKTGYEVTVTAPGYQIWDPSSTYLKHSKNIINTTQKDVVAKCSYFDNDCIGFGRFACLRSSHASIPTPGAFGLLDVADLHITERLWGLHVRLAQSQLGIAATDDPQQLKNLFTLTLASFGYTKPWKKEKRDNITTELFFGTQQDCEDQAACVVAVINHIKNTPWKLCGMEKTIYDMCKNIDTAYVVSLWADPQTAGASGQTRAGHCVCMIKYEGTFQIIEATSPITPYDTLVPYGYIDKAVLNAPSKIDLGRYLKFAFMANESTSFFVGKKVHGAFHVGLTLDELNGKFDTLEFGHDNKMRDLHDTLFKKFTILPCLDPVSNENLHRALDKFRLLFPELFVEPSKIDASLSGAATLAPQGDSSPFYLPTITLHIVKTNHG